MFGKTLTNGRREWVLDERLSGSKKHLDEIVGRVQFPGVGVEHSEVKARALRPDTADHSVDDDQITCYQLLHESCRGPRRDTVWTPCSGSIREYGAPSNVHM